MLLCTLYILLCLTFPTTLQIANILKSLHVKFLMTSKNYLQTNSLGNNSTSRKVVLKTNRNYYQHAKNCIKSQVALQKCTKVKIQNDNYRFLFIVFLPFFFFKFFFWSFDLFFHLGHICLSQHTYYFVRGRVLGILQSGATHTAALWSCLEGEAKEGTMPLAWLLPRFPSLPLLSTSGLYSFRC